jgi:uncharacterized damage-inducible protein DinB
MNDILKANLLVINQLKEFLESLPTAIYYQPLQVLHNQSIGQHTRHVVEFYGCLLAGIANTVVNYDLRERNIAIEKDKELAINFLEKTKAELIKLQDDFPLVLQTNTFNMPISSSLCRELVYMIEHTTHHLAMIRMALSETQADIALSDNFGVATSTLMYRNQAAASTYT